MSKLARSRRPNRSAPRPNTFRAICSSAYLEEYNPNSDDRSTLSNTRTIARSLHYLSMPLQYPNTSLVLSTRFELWYLCVRSFVETSTERIRLAKESKRRHGEQKKTLRGSVIHGSGPHMRKMTRMSDDIIFSLIDSCDWILQRLSLLFKIFVVMDMIYDI